MADDDVVGSVAVRQFLKKATNDLIIIVFSKAACDILLIREI